MISKGAPYEILWEAVERDVAPAPQEARQGDALGDVLADVPGDEVLLGLWRYAVPVAGTPLPSRPTGFLRA